jgi:hypothetical protein
VQPSHTTGTPWTLAALAAASSSCAVDTWQNSVHLLVSKRNRASNAKHLCSCQLAVTGMLTQICTYVANNNPQIHYRSATAATATCVCICWPTSHHPFCHTGASCSMLSTKRGVASVVCTVSAYDHCEALSMLLLIPFACVSTCSMLQEVRRCSLTQLFASVRVTQPGSCGMAFKALQPLQESSATAVLLKVAGNAARAGQRSHCSSSNVGGRSGSAHRFLQSATRRLSSFSGSGGSSSTCLLLMHTPVNFLQLGSDMSQLEHNN